MASTAKAFAASDKTRNILLAKVHIAKKQLGLDEDAYEGVLMRVAGTTSAGACTVPQLRLVVEDFERRGFTAVAKRPGTPRRADHAVARKARVMWISLAHLCAVREEPAKAIRGDKALEAFACRQLACAKFQWADQSQGDKLIEALKAIAERHGWDQSAKGFSGRDMAKVDYVHALKARLCDAILAKLKRAGVAADHWLLGEAAYRLTGMGAVDRACFTTQELEQMAAALGAKLRAHGGPGAFLEIGR
ncbi:regulatory protein GemA [Sphingobium yanoikuyae]|uniref:regulatory protein GemA n=1 Tax=Sphingobium yanoikuyae TaxID=13690 RepID=UPI0026E93C11|nr:regulatory protein GemA [Sphingobium yanoikuyae]